MEGMNYVLAKSFLATGTAALIRGQLVKATAGSTLQPAQVGVCTAITDRPIGVVLEDLDAAKVATGKAYVSVLVLGIAQVVAGAAVSLGDKVSTNAGSAGPPDTRGQTITSASTSIPYGIAMGPAAAQGDYISVLLMPGLPATP
jgi:hypothetical protein